MLHRFFYIIQAIDIQKCFLLAGKRSIRQIFCRGRRAHRHRNVFGARIGHHFFPGYLNVGIQLGRKRGVQNPLADFLAHPRQFHHIFHIQRGQCRIDALAQAFMRQKAAIGIGGGGKATRHAHAFFGELANHFAQ